jgi:hypothetical protein
MVTMLGCRRAATARASVSNRAARSGSAARFLGEDLQRDVTAELRVAGAVDLPHPADRSSRTISYWARRRPVCMSAQSTTGRVILLRKEPTMADVTIKRYDDLESYEGEGTVSATRPRASA